MARPIEKKIEPIRLNIEQMTQAMISQKDTVATTHQKTSVSNIKNQDNNHNQKFLKD